MNILKLLALAVTLIFGAAALAEVEEKRELKIVIAGASPDDSTTFHWVSDHADFDMQGMQLGETHSIVDESGRSVLITREVEGFRFDIDGETIMIPDMGGHEAHMAFVDVGGSDFSADIDIEVIGDHQLSTSHDADGVTIISGEPLDAATRESIKAVLQSAGRDDEVTFIDGSGGSDGRHIKIIKKRVEVVH
jgi:hypothetical protein